jgi:hypothetical protein
LAEADARISMNDLQPVVPIRAHRGAIWLILGLLSFPLWISGVVAWIMADRDLKAMAQGQMDPSGGRLTKAGKILGIIGLTLNLLWIGKRIVIDGVGNMGPMPPH